MNPGYVWFSPIFWSNYVSLIMKERQGSTSFSVKTNFDFISVPSRFCWCTLWQRHRLPKNGNSGKIHIMSRFSIAFRWLAYIIQYDSNFCGQKIWWILFLLIGDCKCCQECPWIYRGHNERRWISWDFREESGGYYDIS